MREPAYPTARAVAPSIARHLAQHAVTAAEQGQQGLAPVPSPEEIEALVETAFWASLRREEGHDPKISLAFLPPERAGQPLLFERPLPFDPAVLAKVSPAVERPGIHLGVWRDGGDLHVWGTTRTLPCLCFVLEVVEPGHLVIKYRRNEGMGKFGNVAELRGDRSKVVDERRAWVPDYPDVLKSLLRFDARSPGRSATVLVQLATSMRAHGRGGAMLVVPSGSRAWRESIVWPSTYLLAPPLTDLSELVYGARADEDEQVREEALRSAVSAVAGLTAVDGATVITSTFEVLAFGVKIGRAEASRPVREVILSEPVEGDVDRVVHPSLTGGTRHLSAAQFVYDQRDALALVASQDGRFSIFAWSPSQRTVRAHRVEALLL